MRRRASGAVLRCGENAGRLDDAGRHYRTGRQTARQSWFYQWSNDENALLINWNNDLFYYQFGSDKALRITNNPEEEVGETFSPDDRMFGFVRSNNIYVYDLAAQRERA